MNQIMNKIKPIIEQLRKWLSNINLDVITMISIRNLVRQRRRNFTLGIAIAVGVIILVLTNSFSRGITDIIFNQMLVHSYGHVNVALMENGQTRQAVTRDKDRIIKIIKDNLDNVQDVNQYIASFTRVIGNGKSGFAAIVGLPADTNMIKWFESSKKSGNAADYTNNAIENPVIVYDTKAKDLNVKVGDSIKVRTTTIHGQVQSAKLTVIEIIKSSSPFEAMAMYIPLHKQKELLGYEPQESGPLQIVFKKMDNPFKALKEANKLYALLKPNLAVYYGMVSSSGQNSYSTTLSFFTNADSMKLLAQNTIFTAGSLNSATNSNQAAVSSALAASMGIKAGDRIINVYDRKFGGQWTNDFKIAAVLKLKDSPDAKFLLVSENNFYKNYYQNIPLEITNFAKAYLPATNSVYYPALATEWKLLKRTANTTGYEDKLRNVAKEKWEGAYLDVSTMFEFANFAIMLESVLNLICVLAILFIFSFILVGVVNALRMSIRERTREIGTNRAIGMQREDVRNNFLQEIFFLGIISSIVGVIAGFILMGLLSLIPIETDSFLGVFLFEKHLHFVPILGGWVINIILMVIFGIALLVIEWDKKLGAGLTKFLLIFNVVLMILIPIFGVLSAFGGHAIPNFYIGILTIIIVIMMILVVTAYFPSSKAAKLSAAEALRHYE